jgi:hypothetical protein
MANYKDRDFGSISGSFGNIKNMKSNIMTADEIRIGEESDKKISLSVIDDPSNPGDKIISQQQLLPDGTPDPSAPASTIAVVAGYEGSVQFNSGGVQAGDSGFLYDTNGIILVSNTIFVPSINVASLGTLAVGGGNVVIYHDAVSVMNFNGTDTYVNSNMEIFGDLDVIGDLKVSGVELLPGATGNVNFVVNLNEPGPGITTNGGASGIEIDRGSAEKYKILAVEGMRGDGEIGMMIGTGEVTNPMQLVATYEKDLNHGEVLFFNTASNNYAIDGHPSFNFSTDSDTLFLNKIDAEDILANNSVQVDTITGLSSSVISVSGVQINSGNVTSVYNVSVTNNVEIQQDLTVINNVEIQQNLTVFSNAIFQNNVEIYENLTVSSNSLFQNNVVIDKNLIVQGDVDINGSLQVDSLEVTGGNVTIGGVNLNQGNVSSVHNILVGNNAEVSNLLLTDDIVSLTSGSTGVTIESVKIENANVTGIHNLIVGNNVEVSDTILSGSVQPLNGVGTGVMISGVKITGSNITTVTDIIASNNINASNVNASYLVVTDILADTITSETGGSTGVTIESVKIENANATGIHNLTVDNNVSVSETLHTDKILPDTDTATGVLIAGVQIVGTNVTSVNDVIATNNVDATNVNATNLVVSNILADTIVSETGGSTGVTIESVKIENANATGIHNLTVDNNVSVAETLHTDKILPDTDTATGVLIAGVQIIGSNVTSVNDVIASNNVDAVNVNASKLVVTDILADNIVSETGGSTGVTVESVKILNANMTGIHNLVVGNNVEVSDTILTGSVQPLNGLGTGVMISGVKITGSNITTVTDITVSGKVESNLIVRESGVIGVNVEEVIIETNSVSANTYNFGINSIETNYPDGDLLIKRNAVDVIKVDSDEVLHVTNNTVFDKSLTVTGNFNVLGDFVSLSVQNVIIQDNILVLNNGEVSTGVSSGNAGIEVERGTLTNYNFLFRESDDAFVIGEKGSEQVVATREDNPGTSAGIPYWDDSCKCFKVDSANMRFEVSTNNVVLNANLVVTSNVFTDQIENFTPSAGVTVDGVLLKNKEATVSVLHYTTLDPPITGSSGTFDGVVLENSNVQAWDGIFSGNVVISQNLYIDTIHEYTPGSGITIEGVVIKDSNVEAGDGVFSGNVVVSLNIIANDTILVDNLVENTPGSGVTIEGVVIKDSNVEAGDGLFSGNVIVSLNIIANDTILVDNLVENTLGSGVTIEGVKLQDSNVEAGEGVFSGNVVVSLNIIANDTILVDNLVENTLGSGVTIEGVVIKGSNVEAGDGVFSGNVVVSLNIIANDTILVDNLVENTPGSGVTIEGVVIKGSNVEAGDGVFSGNVVVSLNIIANDTILVDNLVENTPGSGVTIEGVKLQDSNVYADNGIFSANVEIADTLNVSGNATFIQDISITDNVTIGKDLTLTGNGNVSKHVIPFLTDQVLVAGNAVFAEISTGHVKQVNNSEQIIGYAVESAPGTVISTVNVALSGTYVTGLPSTIVFGTNYDITTSNGALVAEGMGDFAYAVGINDNAIIVLGGGGGGGGSGSVSGPVISTTNGIAIYNSVDGTIIKNTNATIDTDIGLLTTNAIRLIDGAVDTYVLTTDADGLATWQAPSGGSSNVVSVTNKSASPVASGTAVYFTDDGGFGFKPMISGEAIAGYTSELITNGVSGNVTLNGSLSGGHLSIVPGTKYYVQKGTGVVDTDSTNGEFIGVGYSTTEIVVLQDLFNGNAIVALPAGTAQFKYFANTTSTIDKGSALKLIKDTATGLDIRVMKMADSPDQPTGGGTDVSAASLQGTIAKSNAAGTSSNTAGLSTIMMDSTHAVSVWRGYITTPRALIQTSTIDGTTEVNYGTQYDLAANGYSTHANGNVSSLMKLIKMTDTEIVIIHSTDEDPGTIAHLEYGMITWTGTDVSFNNATVLTQNSIRSRVVSGVRLDDTRFMSIYDKEQGDNLTYVAINTINGPSTIIATVESSTNYSLSIGNGNYAVSMFKMSDTQVLVVTATNVSIYYVYVTYDLNDIQSSTITFSVNKSLDIAVNGNPIYQMFTSVDDGLNFVYLYQTTTTEIRVQGAVADNTAETLVDVGSNVLVPTASGFAKAVSILGTNGSNQFVTVHSTANANGNQYYNFGTFNGTSLTYDDANKITFGAGLTAFYYANASSPNPTMAQAGGNVAMFAAFNSSNMTTNVLVGTAVGATGGSGYEDTGARFIGVAGETATAGLAETLTHSVIPRGAILGGYSTLIVGTRYYFDATGALVTSSAGNELREAGIAMSATELITAFGSNTGSGGTSSGSGSSGGTISLKYWANLAEPYTIQVGDALELVVSDDKSDVRLARLGIIPELPGGGGTDITTNAVFGANNLLAVNTTPHVQTAANLQRVVLLSKTRFIHSIVNTSGEVVSQVNSLTDVASPVMTNHPRVNVSSGLTNFTPSLTDDVSLYAFDHIHIAGATTIVARSGDRTDGIIYFAGTRIEDGGGVEDITGTTIAINNTGSTHVANLDADNGAVILTNIKMLRLSDSKFIVLLQYDTTVDLYIGTWNGWTSLITFSIKLATFSISASQLGNNVRQKLVMDHINTGRIVAYCQNSTVSREFYVFEYDVDAPSINVKTCTHNVPADGASMSTMWGMAVTGIDQLLVLRQLAGSGGINQEVYGCNINSSATTPAVTIVAGAAGFKAYLCGSSDPVTIFNGGDYSGTAVLARNVDAGTLVTITGVSFDGSLVTIGTANEVSTTTNYVNNTGFVSDSIDGVTVVVGNQTAGPYNTTYVVKGDLVNPTSGSGFTSANNFIGVATASGAASSTETTTNSFRAQGDVVDISTNGGYAGLPGGVLVPDTVYYYNLGTGFIQDSPSTTAVAGVAVSTTEVISTFGGGGGGSSFDIITEGSPDSGVTIDGVLIKDGKIYGQVIGTTFAQLKNSSGATIPSGSAVFIVDTAGVPTISKIVDDTKQPAGYTTEEILDTVTGTVTLSGSISEGFTGVTVGVKYYLDTSTGTVTVTEGSNSLVGIGYSDTSLLLLAGAGGGSGGASASLTQSYANESGLEIPSGAAVYLVNNSNVPNIVKGASGFQSIGYATAAISTGTSGEVTLNGKIAAGFTGLTIGTKYYLDESAGTVTTDANTNLITNLLTGIAHSNTELILLSGNTSTNTTTVIVTPSGTAQLTAKATVAKGDALDLVICNGASAAIAPLGTVFTKATVAGGDNYAIGTDGNRTAHIGGTTNAQTVKVFFDSLNALIMHKNGTSVNMDLITVNNTTDKIDITASTDLTAAGIFGADATSHFSLGVAKLTDTRAVIVSGLSGTGLQIGTVIFTSPATITPVFGNGASVTNIGTFTTIHRAAVVALTPTLFVTATTHTSDGIVSLIACTIVEPSGVITAGTPYNSFNNSVNSVSAFSIVRVSDTRFVYVSNNTDLIYGVFDVNPTTRDITNGTVNAFTSPIAGDIVGMNSLVLMNETAATVALMYRSPKNTAGNIYVIAGTVSTDFIVWGAPANLDNTIVSASSQTGFMVSTGEDKYLCFNTSSGIIRIQEGTITGNVAAVPVVTTITGNAFGSGLDGGPRAAYGGKYILITDTETTGSDERISALIAGTINAGADADPCQETSNFIGYANAAGSVDDLVEVVLIGAVVSGYTGLVPGTKQYWDSTLKAITETEGSNQFLGVALSSTQIITDGAAGGIPEVNADSRQAMLYWSEAAETINKGDALQLVVNDTDSSDVRVMKLGGVPSVAGSGYGDASAFSPASLPGGLVGSVSGMATDGTVAVACVSSSTSGHDIIVSTDQGQNWTNTGVTGAPTNTTLQTIVYGNGQFIMSATAGVFFSPDGYAWTENTGTNTPDNAASFHYDTARSRWVGGISGTIRYIDSDTDVKVASSWTNMTGFVGGPKQFAQNGVNLVAASSSSPYMFFSSNGTSWTGTTALSTNQNGLVYVAALSKFIATGNGNTNTSFSPDDTGSGTWTTTANQDHTDNVQLVINGSDSSILSIAANGDVSESTDNATTFGTDVVSGVSSLNVDNVVVVGDRVVVGSGSDIAFSNSGAFGGGGAGYSSLNYLVGLAEETAASSLTETALRRVLLQGSVVGGYTTLTPGEKYYASPVVGDPPVTVVNDNYLGIAFSTTQIVTPFGGASVNQFDYIYESTVGAGVNVDGVILKDSSIVADTITTAGFKMSAAPVTNYVLTAVDTDGNASWAVAPGATAIPAGTNSMLYWSEAAETISKGDALQLAVNKTNAADVRVMKLGGSISQPSAATSAGMDLSAVTTSTLAANSQTAINRANTQVKMTQLNPDTTPYFLTAWVGDADADVIQYTVNNPASIGAGTPVTDTTIMNGIGNDTGSNGKHSMDVLYMKEGDDSTKSRVLFAGQRLGQEVAFGLFDIVSTTGATTAIGSVVTGIITSGESTPLRLCKFLQLNSNKAVLFGHNENSTELRIFTIDITTNTPVVVSNIFAVQNPANHTSVAEKGPVVGDEHYFIFSNTLVAGSTLYYTYSVNVTTLVVTARTPVDSTYAGQATQALFATSTWQTPTYSEGSHVCTPNNGNLSVFVMRAVSDRKLHGFAYDFIIDGSGDAYLANVLQSAAPVSYNGAGVPATNEPYSIFNPSGNQIYVLSPDTATTMRALQFVIDISTRAITGDNSASIGAAINFKQVNSVGVETTFVDKYLISAGTPDADNSIQYAVFSGVAVPTGEAGGGADYESNANYVGIAFDTAASSNTETVSRNVLFQGAVLDGFTGLTPDLNYYYKADGTLIDENDGSAPTANVAGIALSSTQLITPFGGTGTSATLTSGSTKRMLYWNNTLVSEGIKEGDALQLVVSDDLSDVRVSKLGVVPEQPTGGATDLVTSTTAGTANGMITDGVSPLGQNSNSMDHVIKLFSATSAVQLWRGNTTAHVQLLTNTEDSAPVTSITDSFDLTSLTNFTITTQYTYSRTVDLLQFTPTTCVAAVGSGAGTLMVSIVEIVPGVSITSANASVELTPFSIDASRGLKLVKVTDTTFIIIAQGGTDANFYIGTYKGTTSPIEVTGVLATFASVIGPSGNAISAAVISPGNLLFSWTDDLTLNFRVMPFTNSTIGPIKTTPTGSPVTIADNAARNPSILAITGTDEFCVTSRTDPNNVKIQGVTITSGAATPVLSILAGPAGFKTVTTSNDGHSVAIDSAGDGFGVAGYGKVNAISVCIQGFSFDGTTVTLGAETLSNTNVGSNALFSVAHSSGVMMGYSDGNGNGPVYLAKGTAIGATGGAGFNSANQYIGIAKTTADSGPSTTQLNEILLQGAITGIPITHALYPLTPDTSYYYDTSGDLTAGVTANVAGIAFSTTEILTEFGGAGDNRFDAIVESTDGAGVTVDGVVCRDSTINVAGITMATGAVNGYVLETNANGTAQWALNSSPAVIPAGGAALPFWSEASETIDKGTALQLVVNDSDSSDVRVSKFGVVPSQPSVSSIGTGDISTFTTVVAGGNMPAGISSVTGLMTNGTKLVAVANPSSGNGIIYSDDDGVTWSNAGIIGANPPPPANVAAANYGNGQFVVGSLDTTGIWFSSDGLSWDLNATANNDGKPTGARGVHYDTSRNRWIIAGIVVLPQYSDTSTITTSTIWTTMTGGPARFTYGMAQNGINIVSGSDISSGGSFIYHTSNGTLWTATTGATSAIFDIVYVSAISRFIAIGIDGSLYKSPDETGSGAWSSAGLASIVTGTHGVPRDIQYNGPTNLIIYTNTGFIFESDDNLATFTGESPISTGSITDSRSYNLIVGGSFARVIIGSIGSVNILSRSTSAGTAGTIGSVGSGFSTNANLIGSAGETATANATDLTLRQVLLNGTVQSGITSLAMTPDTVYYYSAAGAITASVTANVAGVSLSSSELITNFSGDMGAFSVNNINSKYRFWDNTLVANGIKQGDALQMVVSDSDPTDVRLSLLGVVPGTGTASGSATTGKGVGDIFGSGFLAMSPDLTNNETVSSDRTRGFEAFDETYVFSAFYPNSAGTPKCMLGKKGSTETEAIAASVQTLNAFTAISGNDSINAVTLDDTNAIVIVASARDGAGQGDVQIIPVVRTGETLDVRTPQIKTLTEGATATYTRICITKLSATTVYVAAIATDNEFRHAICTWDGTTLSIDAAGGTVETPGFTNDGLTHHQRLTSIPIDSTHIILHQRSAGVHRFAVILHDGTSITSTTNNAGVTRSGTALTTPVTSTGVTCMTNIVKTDDSQFVLATADSTTSNTYQGCTFDGSTTINCTGAGWAITGLGSASKHNMRSTLTNEVVIVVDKGATGYQLQLSSITYSGTGSPTSLVTAFDIPATGVTNQNTDTKNYIANSGTSIFISSRTNGSDQSFALWEVTSTPGSGGSGFTSNNQYVAISNSTADAGPATVATHAVLLQGATVNVAATAGYAAINSGAGLTPDTAYYYTTAGVLTASVTANVAGIAISPSTVLTEFGSANAGTVTADVITEITPGAGVTIEGVQLKDGVITGIITDNSSRTFKYWDNEISSINISDPLQLVVSDDGTDIRISRYPTNPNQASSPSGTLPSTEAANSTSASPNPVQNTGYGIASFDDTHALISWRAESSGAFYMGLLTSSATSTSITAQVDITSSFVTPAGTYASGVSNLNVIRHSSTVAIITGGNATSAQDMHALAVELTGGGTTLTIRGTKASSTPPSANYNHNCSVMLDDDHFLVVGLTGGAIRAMVGKVTGTGATLDITQFVLQTSTFSTSPLPASLGGLTVQKVSPGYVMLYWSNGTNLDYCIGSYTISTPTVNAADFTFNAVGGSGSTMPTATGSLDTASKDYLAVTGTNQVVFVYDSAGDIGLQGATVDTVDKSITFNGAAQTFTGITSSPISLAFTGSGGSFSIVYFSSGSISDYRIGSFTGTSVSIGSLTNIKRTSPSQDPFHNASSIRTSASVNNVHIFGKDVQNIANLTTTVLIGAVSAATLSSGFRAVVDRGFIGISTEAGVAGPTETLLHSVLLKGTIINVSTNPGYSSLPGGIVVPDTNYYYNISTGNIQLGSTILEAGIGISETEILTNF